MSTIQGKMSYNGDLTKAPETDIKLEFSIPRYEYREIKNIKGKTIATRSIVSYENINAVKELKSSDYQCQIPDSFLVGEDISLFGKYCQQSNSSLANFTTTIVIKYFIGTKNNIGERSFDAIYLVQLKILHPDYTSAHYQTSVNQLPIVLINKDAYLDILKDLSLLQIKDGQDRLDYLLPELILSLVDLKDSQPSLAPETKKQHELILVELEKWFNEPQAALKIIKQNFNGLFDFPLFIPEIKVVEAVGTFTVKTSDDSQIAKTDLLKYDLTVEYSLKSAPGNTAASEIIHFDWRKSGDISDNTVAFSFLEAVPIIENTVDGKLSVKVKSYEGAVLYIQEFKPSDPTLKNLKIEVPMIKPIIVDPADIVDKNKKLRGQVISLSKKCVLKNLTVVIQAKKEEDSPWHIVAAANTDSSGNFSMPYPYGIYKEAQAIVSLTPNDPADIAIIPDVKNNKIISDDFLYLLVKENDCVAEGAVEEYDCRNPNKASRLPDYADLIGSDEYTQDLGGSCINLSKPNRTLNEYNYQAIVRTSDPDVANYTLYKTEGNQAAYNTQLSNVDQAILADEEAKAALAAQEAKVAELATKIDRCAQQAKKDLKEAQAVLAVQKANAKMAQQALDMLMGAVDGTPQQKQLNASQAALVVQEAKVSELTALVAAYSDVGLAKLERDKALYTKTQLEKKVHEAQGAVQKQEKDPYEELMAGIMGIPRPAIEKLKLIAVQDALAAQEKKIAELNAIITAYSDIENAKNMLQAAKYQAKNAKKQLQDAQDRLDAAAVGLIPSFALVAEKKYRSRTEISLENPVAWQDAPEANNNLSIYQAVKIATGHILHYKCRFKSDGYSLGDLLYSLPLAPGQKKEIVVIDSQHTLKGAESQTVSQNEQLAASIINDRAITDQLGGNIGESLRGSSSANTSGISAGLGVGANVGYVSGVLGVSGGIANSNSEASQDSSRDVAQFFAEKMRQLVMQNAQAYRQLNASVITTVQEGQTYSATTEVVANHNHCHSLTMMYFEVLLHYAIYQELSSVEECVFVPLLMTNFTTKNITKWRDVLASNLLPMPSNTYLKQPLNGQHPLLKAFDANERINTNYANVDFPKGSYDDEYINFVKGEITIRTNLLRPKTRYDRIMSLPVISKTIKTDEIDWTKSTIGTVEDSVKSATLGLLTGGFSLLLPHSQPGEPNIQYKEQQVLARAEIFDQFMQLDANYNQVPPAQCIRVTSFQPKNYAFNGLIIPISGADFFENGTIDKQMWEAYSKILGYTNVYNMLDYYFKGRLIAEWDDIFYNDIAPLVFSKIVDSIKLDFIAIDLTSTARYKGGERLMRINLNGITNKERNKFPLIIRMFCNNANVSGLKDMVTLTIENVKIFYFTTHYNGTLFSGYIGDDLLDGTDLFIPENNDEKRNPKREDAYIVGKLIEHLNSNLEYYNRVLWYNLDQERRYMLLDGFQIEVFDDVEISGKSIEIPPHSVFNDLDVPAKGIGRPLRPLHNRKFRSLASVVKNELITITGNSLVFPVAPGYKVSQSFITKITSKRQSTGLLDHYQPLTPIEPYRISVPTRGVFAEAVLGSCNACEELETDRLQDWNKYPITDEPTQILPVTTPTLTNTDWKAAYKEFASPLVNIQNAPTTPEPGAGLAGLSNLLGKSDVFKDITGLDANQQNVLKTYLSNQENAKAFAEMAKSMAMQSHNTENSDKILSSINEAKKSGAINDSDYAKLVKDHLGQQIDGGETKKVDLEKEKATKPSLSDAAIKAAGEGKEVKAQKTDTEGNAETIEISGRNISSVLAKVDGVPKLKQPSKNSCWATVATMMKSWKTNKSLTIEHALNDVGSQYLEKFQDNQSLLADEKDLFINLLGMVEEQPGDYNVEQYVDWMNTYGPIWVTIDAALAAGVFSPHAVVLTKIEGTGTLDGTEFYYNNPWTGIEEHKSFKLFTNAFEQMITDNKGATFIQIVHFKDRLIPSVGEGGQTSLTEEQTIAKLKAENKLDFDGKIKYLEYLTGKSFPDALQAIYSLSKIPTTGFATIKDLLDRKAADEAEKAAYKIVDDKGVIRRLNVIYNENIPTDLSDAEKDGAAQFFADIMETKRGEIQAAFSKTGAEDNLTLSTFPKTAEVKENAEKIIRTCMEYGFTNKKHIAYCLATANGESKFLPVMEASYSNVYGYFEKAAQYYYSKEGTKASYNRTDRDPAGNIIPDGQIQLSDYLISQLTALSYIKVTDLTQRTFTKGDNIDDVNFEKLKTLLTVSLSKKDAKNNWIDIVKDASETAALFTEMAAIMNSEKPPKKIITEDLLMNADFYRYAGKGLIQTTWKASYKNVISKIKIDIPGFTVDLVNEPEKIMIADNAIYALVFGLKNGAYGPGKPLSDYLVEGVVSTDTDWEKARNCVNVQERAKMFAQGAKIYADLVFRLQA